MRLLLVGVTLAPLLIGNLTQNQSGGTSGSSPLPTTQTPTPPIQPRIVPTPDFPPIALPPTPGASAFAPLTANEAARIALRNQPTLTIAAANVNSARGRLDQVRSGLFPRAVISAAYSRNVDLSFLGIDTLNNGGTTGFVNTTGGTGNVTAGGTGSVTTSGTGSVTTGNVTGITTGVTGVTTGITGTTASDTTGTGLTTGGTGDITSTGTTSGTTAATTTGIVTTGTTTSTAGTTTATVGTTAGTTTGVTTTGNTGVINPNNTGIINGFFSGLSTSFTVTQLLYDFGRTRDNVRQQEAVVRSTQASFDTSQNNLVLQVKQAFYTFVQNVRQVAVNEANLRDREGQLALARASFEAGLGAPADVVTAQTQVNQATLDLINSRNTALASRLTLAQLMGIDPRTPITAADSEERLDVSSDLNGLVDEALQARPEIRSAKETLTAAGYAVSVARKLNLPSLNLAFNVAERGGDSPFSNAGSTVGVSLSFPILDGGLRRGTVRSAEANRVSAQAQLQSTAQQIVTNVSQAYLELQTAYQRVTIGTAQVANAVEGVRLATGRYRAGVATFLEVITAQALLVQARTNEVNAQASLQQARAALERAVGRAPID